MDHLNKEEILTHHLHTNKIDWTNKAIQNLKYNGQVTDRLRLNYKFNYEKGSYLKGLSIRWTPKLNKKIFQLVYWFRDRTFRLDLGEFSPTFGTHECTQVILELSKKYKDNKGNWIKNPVEEIKKSKETTELKNIENKIKDQKSLTIRQTIEKICESGFPRKNIKGFLSSDNILQHIRYFIGYNKRRTFLRFIDNAKGHGEVLFKDESPIKTWQELFKKYPAGVGVDKEKGLVSLYDSELGALKIKDLTPGLVEDYINETHKHVSFGTRKNILNCLSTLWFFARSHLKCFGSKPPLNPCRKAHGGISIVREEQNNYLGKKYNNLVLTLEELDLITDTLKSLRDQYPYIAEALLFLAYTGMRVQEALKVRYDMITTDKDGDPVIIMKRFILKGRGSANQEDEIFDITNPVQEVLDMVQQQLDKPEHTRFRLLNTFVFLSPRLSIEKLINPEIYPGYKDSQECRLKEAGLVNCWREVKRITGLDCAIKTLRKTYMSTAFEVCGPVKSKSVTHHKHSSTTDRHYVKVPRREAKQYSKQVAEILQFPLKRVV